MIKVPAWGFGGALGGTRTPNLLIRSLTPAVRGVSHRPASAFPRWSQPLSHPARAAASSAVPVVRATSVQDRPAPLQGGP